MNLSQIVFKLFFFLAGLNLTSLGISQNVLIEMEERAKEDAMNIVPSDVIIWRGLTAVKYLDDRISLTLSLETKRQFSLYRDKIEFLPPPGMQVLKVNAPVSEFKIDPMTGKEVEVYSGGTFELELKSLTKISSSDPLSFAVKSVGCTTRICLLPFTQPLQVRLVESNTPSPVQLDKPEPAKIGPPDTSSTSSVPSQPPVVPETSNPSPNPPDKIESPSESTSPSKSFESQIAEQVSTNMNLGLLLLLLFLGGILTNLTPCVYPMIPITLRVLSHQGASATIASVFYGLGILVTYTTLGLAAAWSGSVFGSFMASPKLNSVLAIIMLTLGLSMLGYGNFQWLQNLGNKFGTKKRSLPNAFLMGIGAGLVAAPCTGPILASLLAITSSRQDLFEASLLLGTYSLGFATPYVFLGAFSAKLTKKRFSPRIQVAVKTLFAGAIFSVGFLYLKIPPSTFWNFIEPNVLYIGQVFGIVSALMVLLILASRDLFERKNFLVIPALASGIALFCFFQAKYSPASNSKLEWVYNETEAFDLAKKENRPILIDTWAEWCIACKKMEIETFMNPTISREFKEQRWVLLKIDLTESNDANDAIQEKYNIQSLPTVTIIPRGGMAHFPNKRTLTGYQDVASLLTELKKERGNH
jgi:thiol:disulfide interchange protein DsbD